MFAKANSICCIGNGRDDFSDWEQLADFVTLVVVLTYLSPSLDHNIFHIPSSFVEASSSSSMGFWAIPSDELHESRVIGELHNPRLRVTSELGDLVIAQALGYKQRDS